MLTSKSLRSDDLNYFSSIKSSLILLILIISLQFTSQLQQVQATKSSQQWCDVKYESPNKIACDIVSNSTISSSPQQLFDFFAGYKVIASLTMCVKQLTKQHSILGSSVVVESFSKCDLTTSTYISNGSAIINSNEDSFGQCLIAEMNSQIDEILNLPCDHYFSYVGTQKIFMAKSGGVYCFDTHYTILTDPVFIFSTSERIVFRMYTTGIINPKFIHLKCSTYRNVFMVMDGPTYCFIRGNVDATIINHKIGLGLGGLSENVLAGSVWARNTGYLTFSDVIIGNASSFSPYEVVPLENYTLCSEIKSTAQSVCSGRGKCDDYNVCNCHTHYYGASCEFTTCFSIPSNNSGSVCSGNGTCTQYNTCTCKEGYLGDQCQFYGCVLVSSVDALGNVITKCEIPVISNITTNETLSNNNTISNSTNQTNSNSTDNYIKDSFAGYKLITTGSILLQNVPSSSLKLSASIIIGSMGPQSYIANGSAVVTLSTNTLGSYLIQKAQITFNYINSLACQYYPSQSTTYLHIKSGGVYCFTQGWSVSGATIIVEGTEPVIFKLSTNLNYGSSKIVYLKCASFRNVFWIVSGSTSVSGTLEGTLIPLSSVNFNNVIVKGAVWNLQSGSSMNFNNVIFTEPETFDPYQKIVGDFCNFTTCGNVKSSELTNVCSGHGSCISYNECECSSGYHSSDCSVTECNHILSDMSTVCSGHGSCNSFNSCVCNATMGFGAQDCEVPICDGYLASNGTVCNGRGVCKLPNICECHSQEYFGQFCQYTSCGGLSSDNLQVCSGKGLCNNFNSCICEGGYYGNNCELFDCFGISKGNPNVCTSRGQCQDLDTCVCEKDYFGYDCRNTLCFGVLNSQPNVCNGHGKCSQHNTCECQGNYSGMECEFTTCYSFNSSYDSVCSSHGKCVDFNNCSCENEYFGNSCQEWNCFTKSIDDPLVCSGNGKCVELNNCSCVTGFKGENCEIRIEYSNNGTILNESLNNSNETSFSNETSSNNTVISNNFTIGNETVFTNETISTPNNTWNESEARNETVYDNVTDGNATSSLNDTTTSVSNETIIDNNQTIIVNETKIHNETNNISNETVSENSTQVTNSSVFSNETLNSNQTYTNSSELSNNSNIGNFSSIQNETTTNSSSLNNSTSLETTNSTAFNETLNNTLIEATNSTVGNNSIANISSFQNETVSNSSSLNNNTVPESTNSTASSNDNTSGEATNSTIGNSSSIQNETSSNSSSLNSTSLETSNSTIFPNETLIVDFVKVRQVFCIFSNQFCPNKNELLPKLLRLY